MIEHALGPEPVLFRGQNRRNLISIVQYVLVKGDSFVLTQFGAWNRARPSLPQAVIDIWHQHTHTECHEHMTLVGAVLTRHTHTHGPAQTYVCKQLCVCVCVCTVCIYICIYYVHVLCYIYVCMYIYTHTHTSVQRPLGIIGAWDNTGSLPIAPATGNTGAG